jgi:hypothetical protein
MMSDSTARNLNRMERQTNNAATAFITKTKTPDGSACLQGTITTAKVSVTIWAKTLQGIPSSCPSIFTTSGTSGLPIRDEFPGVIHYGQSFHYTYDPLAEDFVKWLEKAANHQRGILGKPQNRKDRSAETDPMITDLIADCAGQTQNQERPDCPPKSQTISETRLPPRGCR